MNTDFAKLLSNCMSRVDRKQDIIDDVNVGDDPNKESGKYTENVAAPISTVDSYSVRSEIKNIIEEKFKQKEDSKTSPPAENKSSFSKKEESAKGKILFSLKDFFERSSESEAKEEPSEDDDDGSSGDIGENDDALRKNIDDDLLQESDVEDDKKCVINNEFKIKGKHNLNMKDSADAEDLDNKQYSDLETELNKLEKLKEKLDENIVSHCKKSSFVDLRENKNCETIGKNEGAEKSKKEINQKTQTDVVKEHYDSKQFSPEELKMGIDICKVTDPVVIDGSSMSMKDKSDWVLGDGFWLKVKRHEPEVLKKPNTEAKMEKKEATEDVNLSGEKKETGFNLKDKGIFKNISISVVGAHNKNINIESLFSTKPAAPPPPPPNQTLPNFPNNPNISFTKKRASSSPIKSFPSKRMREPSSVIISSDEEVSTKKPVPTVTLDESTVEESDDDDSNPRENLADQYENCVHGDLTDYMCVECTYSRWRCEWDFVRPRKSKKAVSITRVKPVESMDTASWEKLFKFTGIRVEGFTQKN